MQRLDREGGARVVRRHVDRDGPVEAELPARDLVRLTVRDWVWVRLRLRLRVKMRIRLSVRVRLLRKTSPGSLRGTSERMCLFEVERCLYVEKLGHTARVCCASSFIVTCAGQGWVWGWVCFIVTCTGQGWVWGWVWG